MWENIGEGKIWKNTDVKLLSVATDKNPGF